MQFIDRTSRQARFFSRFLVSLWVVLAMAFGIMLFLNAPSVPHRAPFEGVLVQLESGEQVSLPNRTFDCKETDLKFLCKTTIQNRPLDISMTKGAEYAYMFQDCQAAYNGKPLGCKQIGGNYAPILAFKLALSGLGLSPAEAEQFKATHWANSTFISQAENGLMHLSDQLAWGAAAIAAFLMWRLPPASQIAGLGKMLLSGGVTYGVIRFALFLGLLSLGYAD
jgi:hypothetical protein